MSKYKRRIGLVIGLITITLITLGLFGSPLFVEQAMADDDAVLAIGPGDIRKHEHELSVDSGEVGSGVLEVVGEELTDELGRCRDVLVGC